VLEARQLIAVGQPVRIRPNLLFSTTLRLRWRPAIGLRYSHIFSRDGGAPVGLDTGWKGCNMPRYYFDLVDDETVYDKKGVSLPNIKAAEQYAATFARELMETKPTLMGEAWKAWSVQICNGKFERILKIPFTQIKDLDRSASDDASQSA
jgi:hypothetical protein